jgi:anaerobic selenocysteine-containing dehydrogenase
VSTRRLYDRGVMVEASESMRPLAPPAVARLHPDDLEALGVAEGEPVRVGSARRALQLDTVADARLLRGVVSVDFNLASSHAPNGDGNGHGTDDAHDLGAADLIDARDAVVDVRVERVS